MTVCCALAGAAGFWLVQNFTLPDVRGMKWPWTSGGTASALSDAEQISVAATTAQVAETTKPAEPPEASQAFSDYVNGLRVSGVSLGTSPRALINGRVVHVGDLIDPVQEIRLVEVDGTARNLVFEDRSTARMRKHY